MRLVPVNCIKEGSYLAKTIYDLEGRPLLKKGVSLNRNLLSRIRGFGIRSLYIQDDYSEVEIREVIKPEIKHRALKAIRDTFDTLKGQYETKRGKVTDIRYLEEIEKSHEHVCRLSEIARDIVNDLLSSDNMFINLVDIKTMDNYTYEHSLSVAILSLILGAEAGLPRHELYDLCVGAMLHDVGKIFVPPEILNKPSNLTQAEYDIVRDHVVKGYEYLSRDPSVKTSARLIAIQHHEACDGTGYPKGLRAPQIHKLSKIVAIADTYDAMTSDRPYRMGIEPHEVIEYIMGNAGGKFDHNLVLCFVRKIVPYPVGTLVELSTGHYAVVDEINVNYPLRPIVRIVDPANARLHQSKIDLMEITNIVIKKIQYDLPPTLDEKDLGKMA